MELRLVVEHEFVSGESVAHSLPNFRLGLSHTNLPAGPSVASGQTATPDEPIRSLCTVRVEIRAPPRTDILISHGQIDG